MLLILYKISSELLTLTQKIYELQTSKIRSVLSFISITISRKGTRTITETEPDCIINVSLGWIQRDPRLNNIFICAILSGLL